MQSRGFRSTGVIGTVTRAMSLVGIAALLVNAVVPIGDAAPRPSFLSTQIAQSQPNGNSNEDVIVDTEPQAPGSTTNRPTAGSSTGSSTVAAGTRFTCEAKNGQYVVMYHPESQPGQSYAWANPTNMGGGWNSARRCSEISRRLESYRPDGLQEMQTAVENGYNTVCVTTQNAPSCRIVLTVPAGQDPIATRDSVFQNLTVADSGQQTQAVNTYVGGRESGIVGQIGQVLSGLSGSGNSSQVSNAIDLRPFLDRADGGTAQNLRRGVSSRPARLNPNKFR